MKPFRPVTLLALAVLGGGLASAQDALKAKEADVAAKESAFAEAKARLQKTYAALQAVFSNAREHGAPGASVQELRAIYEEGISAAKHAAEGESNLKKAAPKLKKALAAALGDSFKKARDPAARMLEPVLTEALALDLESDPAAFVAKSADDLVASSFAGLVQADDQFPILWNAKLASRLPDAEEFRKARKALKDATLDLEVIKDPKKKYQVNAPAGMARIPGGTYTVGSPKTPDNRYGFERQKKKVTVHDFYIDLCEVSQKSYWKDFYKTLATDEEREKHRPKDENRKEIWQKNPETGDWEPAEGKGDHPIVGVSLQSAMAYAAKVGKRIPTEDEWEAAASGPAGFEFPWGVRYEDKRCNDKAAANEGTVPVDSMPEGRSPFGIFHMAGNVQEWTATYQKGEKPVVGEVATTENVIVHGGGYKDAGFTLSTHWRWASSGAYDRRRDLGFRCAEDAQ